MIKVSVESNVDELIVLTNKEFKINNSVIDYLTELVRSDIEENLNIGRSYDGSAIQPKKGGGRIFYQTGTLLNSVMKTVSNDVGEIFIGSNRSDIAKYLNFGTSRMVARPFFGIGSRIDSQIDDYLNTLTIEQLLEK